MAPRKIKTQGKRNSIQIKSKSKKEKHALKALKKDKIHEKLTENYKWLNKIPENESFQKSVPEWLREGPYKVKGKSRSSDSSISESEEDAAHEEEEKYLRSETSEECNCNYPETNKNGIPRQKDSSSSIVGKYIKTGMDHVASFIVESAIRFGEEHGVIVPDRNNANLYEFTPIDKKCGDKLEKIWFKIPDKFLNYKYTKKPKWKNQKIVSEALARDTISTSKSAFRENKSESVEKIIPVLKKIKQKNEYLTGDLNEDKTGSDSEVTYEERSRDRMKNRFRKRGKRHKSFESLSDTISDKESKRRKIRCDSLELGRQRLKAAAALRKQESTSQKS